MIVVHLTIPAADGTLVTIVLHIPEKTGDEGFAILDRFIARFPPLLPEEGKSEARGGGNAP